MIRYHLHCSDGHDFEGWFSGSAAFETQKADGLLSCPVCGALSVEKSLMAPALQKSQGSRAAEEAKASEQEKAREEIAALREKILAESTNVGPKFSDEVRAMYYNEKPTKLVHGEASGREVSELLDEGITVLPVPTLPKDMN